MDAVYFPLYLQTNVGSLKKHKAVIYTTLWAFLFLKTLRGMLQIELIILLKASVCY